MNYLSLDRRTVLTIGLAASAASAAPWTRAATPRGTLVVAKNIEDVLTLDPAEAFEANAGEIIDNAYSRLMRADAEDNSRVSGEVAESWQRSEDGKTYTLKIRSGQKFSTGRTLTSDDAAYSLRRVVLLNKTPAFLLHLFGWNRENVAERVRADGDNRLVLQLSEAISPDLVLQVLTTSVASVLDAEALRANEKAGDYGNNWVRGTSAGSGAFRVTSWKAKDAILLEANPTFYAGRPRLDRVLFRHVPESATQALLVGKGDIDIATGLQPDQIRSFAKSRDVSIVRTKRLTEIYIPLNQKNPALANARVREALRWLIDYDGIQKNLLDGQWVVHQSMCGIGMPGALTDNPYHFDLARAKRLLNEAGYGNGLSINLDVETSGPYPDIAQSLQSTFRQAGVQLNLLQADRRQVLTKYRARNHDAILWHASSDYNDPHVAAIDYASNDDNGDGARLKNRAWRSSWLAGDLNQLTQAALVERDSVRRKQLYGEIQRRVRSEGPFIFLFQETQQLALRANVKGYVSGPIYSSTPYVGVHKQ